MFVHIKLKCVDIDMYDIVLQDSINIFTHSNIQ